MIDPNNVFINCPFDKAYFSSLKALLFTLVYIGKKPQISETSDSGQTRLMKIKELMSISKYSIHDLSRMDPLKKGDYPRFNMPFECGFDFGLRMSDNQLYGEKTFLILEKESHRYHKVISDISGHDIKAHKNEPELVIKAVRDWFKTFSPNIPGYRQIWFAYNEFQYSYQEFLENQQCDPDDMEALTFSDIIHYMELWKEVNY